ncbi:MAG TPA: hypothetical protein VK819_02220 [Acidobacteriaceae bacterium]|jgi:hypothetical protein|nr:hypothetical protein [Acidobacteriaceae bacterium]
MKTPLRIIFSACSLAALALLALPAPAQIAHLPQLGDPAPNSVSAAEKHGKVCDTGSGHKDPCAEIEIAKIKFTVAWDAQTKAITYLFTADRRVVTDSQLSVGTTCLVFDSAGAPDPTVPFTKWIIDPKLKGAYTSLAGNATWYAALQKDGDDPHYGNIVGFVQSSYLALKK